jgi:hypothetical protein
MAEVVTVTAPVRQPDFRRLFSPFAHATLTNGKVSFLERLEKDFVSLAFMLQKHEWKHGTATPSLFCCRRRRGKSHLEEGEVEIARLSLTNSVHGEVTSLRAKQMKQHGKISLRMVDEYESEITLPYEVAELPLTSEQVVRLFRDAAPSSTKFGCEFEFQSFFHPDLNEVAERVGVKAAERNQ